MGWPIGSASAAQARASPRSASPATRGRGRLATGMAGGLLLVLRRDGDLLSGPWLLRRGSEMLHAAIIETRWRATNSTVPETARSACPRYWFCYAPTNG